MKKNFLIFAVLTIFVTAGFTQDRTQMRPKDRLIISLFTDIWSDLPATMDTRTINRGVSIDYLQDFPLGTTNFSFAAGLGFASHNLYSNSWYEWDGNGHSFEKIPDNLDYNSNKLSLNYISIPVELRFRTRNSPQTFRIHAGVKGGLLIDAHTKYVGPLPGLSNSRDFKMKEGKLDNIESFILGFQGRIGYGRINLNTFISLTDIFSDNNAQNSSFMSVGLSFIVF